MYRRNIDYAYPSEFSFTLTHGSGPNSQVTIHNKLNQLLCFALLCLFHRIYYLDLFFLLPPFWFEFVHWFTRTQTLISRIWMLQNANRSEFFVKFYQFCFYWCSHCKHFTRKTATMVATHGCENGSSNNFEMADYIFFISTFHFLLFSLVHAL